MNVKKRLTIGILAHVDAGKTTLSEAMLVETGVLAKAGRVDNGDSFLDTDEQEKRRGITIFSGEARMQAEDTELILVDTPGHVDFSAEMERTLSILDAAVLVISGRELVQGHTMTIWNLLQKAEIPVFLFVNKMDLEGTDEDAAMQALKTSLDDGCVLFGSTKPNGAASGSTGAQTPDPEELAMCDERLLDRYLAGEGLEDPDIVRAIARRKVFPCFFGSALKQEGVDALLRGLHWWTAAPYYSDKFAARVYKISRDEKGGRLTHMKITGGTLSVKDVIRTDPSLPQEEGEKIHQIRICSGSRYETVDTAQAGQVVAAAGLEHTSAGQGLGELLGQTAQAMLQPVLTYRMILPENVSPATALQQLRQLEEEDPQLHIRWNEQLQEIQVRLMGEIQLEILTRMISGRFGFQPQFDEGRIEYRETIAAPIQGAGHFEPLRHYAEVHLLLEPLPAGSGIICDSSCSTDVLDTNWQRLIMTHLTEREHPGVLTGSPITDLRITIEGGRAHLKHTEGGDFRQATYRAIRHALRKSMDRGESVLLEPWYNFTMDLPRDQAGKAMADVQRMDGTFEIVSAPSDQGSGDSPESDMITLRGQAPVQEMRGYGTVLASYTKGYGHFSCTFGGYAPCHNTSSVVERIAYDPDRDTDNPADSVFCAHGAGYTVPWHVADEMMHVRIRDINEVREYAYPETFDGWNSGTSEGKACGPGASGGKACGPGASGAGLYGRAPGSAGDKELERIFERTYGRREQTRPEKGPRIIEAPPKYQQKTKPAEIREEYLLVDGYNIIFAWEELRELSRISIDAAREALIDILKNYQGFRQCHVIAVFDAYKVKGGKEHTERQDNITVVFTGEAETADTYIERTTYEMKRRKHLVRVATSDRLEQMIILGNDAFRISAGDFKEEVSQINKQIRDILKDQQTKIQRSNKNTIIIPSPDGEEK